MAYQRAFGQQIERTSVVIAMWLGAIVGALNAELVADVASMVNVTYPEREAVVWH